MTPPITVVVATRNRGGSVADTVETVLAGRYGRYEVWVVDQSEDDRTSTSLHILMSDQRVRYLRTPTVGLARAHNIAIARATSELIAITDDDCEVPCDWLEKLATAFAADRRIGLVFGNVYPVDHDPAAGFVPSYVREEPFLARSLREKDRVAGIGACMGLRRSVWQEIGGFDERLGAGTAFRAGNDGDLAIRVLLAGHFVYETPEVSVLHRGFRQWKEARSLIWGYSYGTGAMLAKHAKCRTPYIPRLLVVLAFGWIRGRRSAGRFGDNRYRGLRLAAFLNGFAAGAVTSVDRAAGCYTPVHEGVPE